MKIHRWLDFKITNRCNNYDNKCGYCDVPVDSPACAESIDLETIHRTLLDARALGFDTFYMLGGEPSIRKDAHRLIEPISGDPDVNITIITNGKVVNESMYNSLFDTAAARACVQISMDSFEKNNLKRANPDNLLRLAENIKREAVRAYSDRHVCEVEIHCVISRENMNSFDEFIRYFADKQIPVSLAMVCPWKIVDEPVSYNEFTRDEVKKVISAIRNLKSGLDTDNFNRLVADFAEMNLNNVKSCVSRECGAGLTHLVINSDGNVYKCMADSFDKGKSLGNIKEQRLHVVLKTVDSASVCPCKTECFDGFAWDKIAVGI
ncbi:MAG TPA: radical SAM protein [Candidatus Goldiibacteriota bacterium]|nr:radical SAM protein [Candidatus Goldiibacteriota bacterium]